MILFIIFTAIYTLVILLDLKSVLKLKKRKVFLIYSLILAVSYTIQTLLVFGVNIPSPTNAIMNLLS